MNTKKTDHPENKEEILDLVDKNDCVIGTLARSKIYAANMHNFRVICGLITNKKGQLWIPRRTAQKKSCPLHLDFSVSGHVDSGENYEQAFKRELQEELNLHTKNIVWEKVGILTPHEHGTFAFNHCYKIFYNDAPQYNPEDFIEYSWLYPEEILELIAQGEKSKSDLPIVIKHFFCQPKTQSDKLF